MIPAGGSVMNSTFILEAFWGTPANCVITAFIKAVLSLIIPSPILRTQTRGRYLQVSMPDQRSWCFTQQEIRELNKGNNLIFRRGQTNADKRKLDKLKTTVRL